MVLAFVAVVLWIALIVTAILFNREPPMLTELKERYSKMLDMLEKTGDPLWKPVLKHSIITGIHGKRDGVIGSNVNKGYEIYICLDGNDVNSAMYVLMHEVAHMSVPEYDHTDKFWENFKKLKKLCIDSGLYSPGGSRRYCGETIRD